MGVLKEMKGKGKRRYRSRTAKRAERSTLRRAGETTEQFLAREAAVERKMGVRGARRHSAKKKAGPEMVGQHRFSRAAKAKKRKRGLKPPPKDE